MKQLLLLLIASFFFIDSASAQIDYETRRTIDLYNASITTNSNWRLASMARNIEGSPYLMDDFTEGSLYTTSKTKYVDVPVRYNIYTDKIEFKTEGDQVMELLVPEVIDKVEMGDVLMEYVPFFFANKVRKGYLIVLEKGKASLYSRPNINFIEAKSPAAYQEAQPARFSRKADDHYIRIGMEPAVLVSKKKDLDEIFSQSDKKVADFIKKNRIRPGNAESLKELVTFYNSLP